MSPNGALIRTDSSREDKIQSSIETVRSKVFFHELVVVEIEENTPDTTFNHKEIESSNTPAR
jgi:hypothetical protein